MSDRVPQALGNHVRYDPLFHFFVIPVFGFAVIWSIVHAVRHPNVHSFALIVLMLAALILVFKARLYALKVQSRVIRLEERLRLSQLLPDSLRARIPDLSESQLVALRFASDAELPALVEQCLATNMSNANIKKAIKNWRPDYFRV
ncbi:hypothetical protein Acid345_1629 [Candidatus Koribacter versatilis Ellin345]|uniref:Uncharacterized protein n=1 Tax=Koribacter versatilis (strain Ellin345) TaxID=204669 RepID=Q1IR69_KORVE|nr:DUF6526 family protein [Candidatus Koribacter versatilis]ABF40631.1 hypothetical protein Acid345_1629 [Candidatus Koribacter versatilis Ellin345]